MTGNSGKVRKYNKLASVIGVSNPALDKYITYKVNMNQDVNLAKCWHSITDDKLLVKACTKIRY